CRSSGGFDYAPLLTTCVPARSPKKARSVPLALVAAPKAFGSSPTSAFELSLEGRAPSRPCLASAGLTSDLRLLTSDCGGSPPAREGFRSVRQSDGLVLWRAGCDSARPPKAFGVDLSL